MPKKEINSISQQSESSSDSLLHPTFHDIEIKLVKIINPNTTSVKFKDHHHHHQQEYDFIKYGRPVVSPLHIDSFQQANTHEDYAKAKVEEVKPKPEVSFYEQTNEETPTQAVPVTNLPIDPHQILSPNQFRGPSRTKEEADEIHHNRMLKQKLREELLLKKQQIFDSLNRNHRRSSGKRRGSSQESRYFEVAPGIIVGERPVSRNPLDTSPFESRKYIHSEHKPTFENRAATVPSSRKSRIWTGHRSGSSRVMSSVSSRWKTEEPALPRPNVFIKMPFKQVPVMTMDNNYKVEDDLVLPGDELRATTAFALSRIRHGFRRMAPPNVPPSRQGRLVKAKLKPLRPVPAAGPHISSCQGVQPEMRRETNSPNPERLRYLKQQYLKACRKRKHSLLKEEYDRRTNAHSAASDHSLHRTSPQPENDPDYQKVDYPVNFSDDEENNQPTEDPRNEFLPNRNCRNEEGLEQKIAAMRLESRVIF